MRFLRFVAAVLFLWVLFLTGTLLYHFIVKFALETELLLVEKTPVRGPLPATTTVLFPSELGGD